MNFASLQMKMVCCWFFYSLQMFSFVKADRLNGNIQIEWSGNIWRPYTKFQKRKKSFPISIDVNGYYPNLIGFYVNQWWLFFVFIFIHSPKTCYMRSCICVFVGGPAYVWRQVLKCFQLWNKRGIKRKRRRQVIKQKKRTCYKCNKRDG